uniref:Uncharacterized protein n=1 Tax=Kalanchoe fedtschenkoi TaxID=63787 RepID=A0A7N0UN67_KALFE
MDKSGASDSFLLFNLISNYINNPTLHPVTKPELVLSAFEPQRLQLSANISSFVGGSAKPGGAMIMSSGIAEVYAVRMLHKEMERREKVEGGGNQRSSRSIYSGCFSFGKKKKKKQVYAQPEDVDHPPSLPVGH